MSEVERTIENQPWNFDKHLVVMEKFESSLKLNELPFDKAWFWVQVHDIPVHFMSEQVAENICDIIGECVGRWNQLRTMEENSYGFVVDWILIFRYAEGE